MRIIDTTQVVDPNVQQPLLATSIDFLTQNQIETLNSIIQTMIGPGYSATQVYVLYGCVVTGVYSGAGNFSMTAGAVFYGGEIFQVAAVTTTAVGSGNTVYSLLHSAPTTVDPYDNTRALDAVTFSDGSTKNVHLTRTWVTSILTTGSGTNAVSSWIILGNQAVGYTPGVNFNTNFQNISGSSFLYYSIKGGVLYINGSFAAVAANIASPVITLPVPFRPKFDGYGIGQVIDVSGTIPQYTMILYRIDTGGGLTVLGFSGTTTNQFVVTLAFPLN